MPDACIRKNTPSPDPNDRRTRFAKKLIHRLAATTAKEFGMKFQGRFLGLAVAILVALTNALVVAQTNTCNSCASGVVGSWPSGSGRFSAHQQRHAEAQAQQQKIFDRNVAWMKPFNCWDRTAYFNTWSTFTNAGTQAACTLCDAHFDEESGTINNLGKQKVLEIMANTGNPGQQLFVLGHYQDAIHQERMSSVRAVVSEWFGDDKTNLIVATDQKPVRFNGSRVQAINVAYKTQPANPSLQSTSSGGSAADAASGSGSTGQ